MRQEQLFGDTPQVFASVWVCMWVAKDGIPTVDYYETGAGLTTALDNGLGSDDLIVCIITAAPPTPLALCKSVGIAGGFRRLAAPGVGGGGLRCCCC